MQRTMARYRRERRGRIIAKKIYKLLYIYKHSYYNVIYTSWLCKKYRIIESTAKTNVILCFKFSGGYLHSHIDLLSVGRVSFIILFVCFMLLSTYSFSLFVYIVRICDTIQAIKLVAFQQNRLKY